MAKDKVCLFKVIENKVRASLLVKPRPDFPSSAGHGNVKMEEMSSAVLGKIE